jgi:tetratricopeptide (TPR) repeat protein
VWKNDIALWSDALHHYPDGRLNFIYDKRARQYLEKEMRGEALADYKTMLANDPRDEKALEGTGMIYGRYYNDLPKAVEYLGKAYAINPRNPAVLKTYGVVMGMSGNLQKSLDLLLLAYDIDKTDSSLMRNISLNYRYLGNPAKEKEFDKLARSFKMK